MRTFQLDASVIERMVDLCMLCEMYVYNFSEKIVKYEIVNGTVAGRCKMQR